MKHTERMNYKYITIAFAILFVFFMSGCKKNICTVFVDAGTGEKTISAETGEIINICLPAQISTGFSWNVKDKSESVVMKGEPVIQENEPKEKATGQVEKQVFTFEVIEPENSFVEFIYSQPWKKEKEKNRIVRVNIIVD